MEMNEYMEKTSLSMKTAGDMNEKFKKDLFAQQDLNIQIERASEEEVEALKQRTMSAMLAFKTSNQLSDIVKTQAAQSKDPELVKMQAISNEINSKVTMYGLSVNEQDKAIQEIDIKQNENESKFNMNVMNKRIRDKELLLASEQEARKKIERDFAKVSQEIEQNKEI